MTEVKEERRSSHLKILAKKTKNTPKNRQSVRVRTGGEGRFNETDSSFTLLTD